VEGARAGVVKLNREVWDSNGLGEMTLVQPLYV
jgi:hypothetical protein